MHLIMILKSVLEEVAKSQAKNLKRFDYGIDRELLNKIAFRQGFALIISGIRRSGKSTLAMQAAKKLRKFYYFNFEDPRVKGIDAQDLVRLDEVLKEAFGESDYYLFDEIQNVKDWEAFVRSRLNSEGKFIITGSNASLLSKELGTKLTGRNLIYELFPFSFKEFLEFKKLKASLRSFDEYFNEGGFPEYLRFGDSTILTALLNDIISRDILARYKIRSQQVLTKMAIYLLSSVGREFTYNGLSNLFGVGSVNTAVSFVSYLEDSYLIFTIPKFDYSLRKQAINPKKVYSVDNGLTLANSISNAEDKGRLLENLAFLGLRRNHKSIFYFKGKKECDFLVKEKNKIVSAIQVCYQVNDENREREFSGLEEAMSEFSLDNGMILTYKQEDEITLHGKKVYIIPLWKWLLNIN